MVSTRTPSSHGIWMAYIVAKKYTGEVGIGETMAIFSFNIARYFADFAQVVDVLRRSVHVSNSVRIYTSRSLLLRSLGICKQSMIGTDLYDHFVR
jgi:hypothetical protein